MHLAAKLALAGFVPVSLLAGRAWMGSPCCTAPNPPAAEQAVTGRYVEARSASVYAGACHYGAEYTTQGREAVLAWELTGGVVDGVSLEGVELVVVVSSQDNLAEADARRESIVYLDADLATDVRAAALAWLEREHGDVVGTLRQVKPGAVSVDCAGERYSVQVPGLVRLEGEAMPDRACCSMPSNVWYRPLVALSGRLVGQSEVFSVSDPDVGPSFVRHAENDAFLGDLARSSPRPCAPAGDLAGASTSRAGSCCPLPAQPTTAP